MHINNNELLRGSTQDIFTPAQMVIFELTLKCRGKPFFIKQNEWHNLPCIV